MAIIEDVWAERFARVLWVRGGDVPRPWPVLRAQCMRTRGTRAAPTGPLLLGYDVAQEAEAQRRKHYGIGEYYNGGSGGGGGGGDGDGDGGGGSGASTASITTSSLTPPTAPQRAAAATRMLSPRGAPPRRVVVPPPPDPAPEPPAALSGPAAAARARRRSCDQLTPMQRRAQARAAELRAEHRALRSAADKDPYFA